MSLSVRAYRTGQIAAMLTRRGVGTVLPDGRSAEGSFIAGFKYLDQMATISRVGYSGAATDLGGGYPIRGHDSGSGNRRFESSRPSQCRVSGHRGHISHVIVDNSRPVRGGR